MKLRNLFLAAVAGVAALVGCNKEVDLGPAKLILSQEQLNFGQAASSQTVTFTSTRDWAVAWANVPEWIALDKENGLASTDPQSLSVSVMENKGHNRSATLTLTIGFAQGFVHIFQEGPEGEVDNGNGSFEKPFTVTGVIDYVNSLGADVNSPEKVYIKGIVSAIDEAFTTQYGNGSFKISDDGTTAGGQFTAYRVMYLGNKKFTANDKQVATGDEVIVYGNVVLFKGNTPETQQNNAYLYSLNGDTGGATPPGPSGEAKGTGTADDPFNVAAAIAKAKETGTTATSESYYIKGKVATVKEQFSAQYGNATFTMVDEGAGDEFTAYRVLYFDNKKWTAGGKELATGDDVVVYAKIVNFMGNTPETSGGYVYSINGEGGKETPGPGPSTEAQGTGTADDPFNIAAAIAKAKETGETATSEVYYIKGIVKTASLSAQYKNADLDLIDEGGSDVFKAFRIKGFDGADITGNEPIAAGDEVVICGNIVNFKGNTPETTQGGKLVLWNGKTSFDGGEPGPDNPGEATGTGSADDPFNIAAAIAKAKETGETATAEAYYIKGIVKTVSLSAQYKNADLDLIDEGGSDVFKAFRIKGFDGADITGNEPIKAGDEVVIYGNIVNYKSNTPETTQGGKLVLWNGKTSFDGEEPGPGPETDEIKVVSVAEFLAAPVSTEQWYELTGTVSNIVMDKNDATKVNPYGNFDLTDDAGTTVYVYGLTATKVEKNDKSFESLGIQEGDNITIITLRAEYQGKAQAGGTPPAYLKSKNSGVDPGPGPDPGDGAGTGTAEDPFNVAAAIAKAVETGETATSEVYYIKGIVKTVSLSAQYKNADLDLVDEGGSDVFKAFRIKGFGGADITGNEPIKAGDEVVVCGNIVNYKSNTPETTQGGQLVLWNGKTSFEGEEPGPGPDPGEEGEFDSNVTWTLVENAQDNANSTVNNVSGVSVLKLGTGSKYGKATLELPEGSTVLEFYAVSWNNAEAATLVFTIVTGETIASVETVPNSTLKGNPPFTLTVTDDDKYEIEVPEGVTEITVETTGGYRAALFGIQAQ